MTLAITGASGRLAQAIARTVRDRDAAVRLRLISRDADRCALPLHPATEVARGDFDDPSGLAAVFAGIDTVMLIATDAEPERRLRQHRQAIAAARAAGVVRIVLASPIGAAADSSSAVFRVAAATEAALRDAATFTILQTAPAAEALKTYLAATLGANRLIMPAADAAVAYLTRANLAEAAAGSLLGTEHANRVYTITGSHALTASEIAALAGDVRGVVPTVIDADPWEFQQAMSVPFGAPRHVLDAERETWRLARTGAFETVSGDAEALAGRPLPTLPAFVRAATPGIRC